LNNALSVYPSYPGGLFAFHHNRFRRFILAEWPNRSNQAAQQVFFLLSQEIVPQGGQGLRNMAKLVTEVW